MKIGNYFHRWKWHCPCHLDRWFAACQAEEKSTRVTFGPDLCDNELLAKTYYEDFEESLAECSLEAERLRDVVSEEKAQDQRKLKADPARQHGMHLDGKLTLQTRRKFTSSEPANQEQLRAKYTSAAEHVALGAAQATRIS